MTLDIKKLLAHILGVDFRYPVGSYYETSLSSEIPSQELTPTSSDLSALGDTWFDPNYAWGGTWELETPGQVHVSSGTGYALGATGGKDELTLRAAIGACNNNSASLGYITTGPTVYQQNHAANYVIQGTGINYSHWNHATPVVDASVNSDKVTNMQPYIVVNRWHRTA